MQDFGRGQVAAVNSTTSLVYAGVFSIAITVDQFVSEHAAFSRRMWLVLFVTSLAQALAYAAFSAYEKRSAALAGKQQLIQTGAIFASLPYIGWQFWATGAIDGPYWGLFILSCIMCGLVAQRAVALSFGVCAGTVIVLASAIQGLADRDHAGKLAWISMLFVMTTWVTSQIGAGLRDLEERAVRDRMALETRVDELSRELDRASEGDLSVAVDEGAGHEALDRLGSSFNATVSNLRTLVGQIRSGGEQIGASAGELLATAEEHAASATQQSSAVSETTST
ncbi:MAG TPA: methyl-accepting chemotaxis protein, partial [Mycobacteriales bacterium]|nr:methyl-accepting chemotaxis protein [Mycobacteriales bacterium]